MKRIAMFLLVSIFATVASVAQVTNQFSFPISPWEPNCNTYWGTCNIPDSWHLGVDVLASPGDEVHAFADGVVKHVSKHSGYGHVVIIEHILSNGEIVCSLYGHLNSSVQVSTGQAVAIGDVIGYIGSTAENGGWDPHLHFAIKKGVFNLSGYNYVCDGTLYWGYSGYTKCAGQQNTWHDPLDFIAAHQVLVAQYSDGTLNQAILDCINLHADLGLTPHDNGGGLNVHEWYSMDGTGVVTIQDLRDQYEHDYAAIYNTELQKAFLIGGDIRYYYMNLDGDGPKILGAPATEQYKILYYQFFQGQFQTNTAEYPKVDWDAQKFSTGITIITRPDMGTFERDSTDVGGGGNFGIALLPGNGTTLQINAYALSPTSVQVNGSPITGAASYAVYQDGALVGYLNTATLDLTIEGLAPESTHRYQLVAHDQNGSELVTSSERSVTLPDLPGASALSIEVTPRGTYIDVSWVAASGALNYAVLFDGTERFRTPNLFATVYSIPTDGSHQVSVRAYSPSGVLLAEGRKTVNLGQNWYIRAAPVTGTVGSDETVTVQFSFINETDYPVQNFRNQIVSVFPENWMTVVSYTINQLSYVSPRSSMPLGTVTIRTGSGSTLADKVVVIAASDFSGNLNGNLNGSRSGDCVILVEPFMNDAPLLSPLPYQPDVSAWTDVEIGRENRSNAPSGQSRLELYVDGDRAASLATPALSARERWQTIVSLPPLPDGRHTLRLVTDTYDDIDEFDETDNETSGELIVGQEAQAILDAIAAAAVEAERIANEPLPPREMSADSSTDVFLPFDGPVGTDQKLGNAASMVFPLREHGLPLSVLGVDGTTDGAYRFSGGECLIGEKNAWLPSQWTIEGWFRTTKRQDQYLWQILHGMYGDDIGIAVYMSWDIPGIRVCFADGSSYPELYGVTDIRDGEWHYVALTFDGTVLALYVDGALEVSGLNGHPKLRDSYPMIGARGMQGQPQSHFFEGEVDNIRLSPVARDRKEVAAIYAGTSITSSQVADGAMAALTEMEDGNDELSDDEDEEEQDPRLLLRLICDGVVGNDQKLRNTVSSEGNIVESVNGYASCDGHEGASDAAIVLDADARQYLQLPRATMDAGNVFTFMCWVKSDAISRPMYLAQHYSEGGGSYTGWVAYFDRHTGKPRFFRGAGSPWTEAIGKTNVLDGQWHHLAFVCDGINQFIYVDGALDGASGAVNVSSITGNVRIGCASLQGGYDGYNYHGALDDIRFYGAALSVGEVVAVATAITP